jgi:hypothetical protein
MEMLSPGLKEPSYNPNFSEHHNDESKNDELIKVEIKKTQN